MNWVQNYDFFLFDFDGLLVDTERLHHEAYVRLCSLHAVKMPWNFEEYCAIVHRDPRGLEKNFYRNFPQFASIPWTSFYAQKKELYLRVLNESQLQCMPGAEQLLLTLEEKQIRRCVVTHSPKIQIETIRNALPVLQTIPHWLTREDYTHPKPDPECYRKAVALWGRLGDRLIGFEDSARGLAALQGSGARCVLVCRNDHPQMGDIALHGAAHFESLIAIKNLH